MNLNKTIELQQLELEKDINDIHEIYKNINEIIQIQGETLETITDNLFSTETIIHKSSEELHDANEYYKSYKKYTYILTGITILGTLLLIL